MKRSTWTMISILVILILATFIVMRRPGERSSSGSAAQSLFTVDSAGVDKIEIRSLKGTLTLEKQGMDWMLTSPVHYKADPYAVSGALGKGSHLDVTTVVSDNPANQHLFQVDSSGCLVRMYQNGSQVAAFYVGKPGSSFTDTYVRKDGSNDVYSADGLLTYIFSRDLREWRDRTIFKADEEAIHNVSLRYGDTTVALAFQDSAWRVDGDSAAQPTVRTFLSSLANLQADDFVDSTVSGVTKPACVIDVGGTQLRFYLDKPSDKYYVQSSQFPQWFTLQSWRANQILKRAKDFRKA